MPVNTHRLGVQKADGSIKLIASGSFDFCLAKFAEYEDKTPDHEDVLICEAHSKPGYPPDWDKTTTTTKEETDAEADH